MTQVLDHGYVQLIDHCGSDQSIVRAARVSYDGDGSVPDVVKDAKLLGYLADNGHTSPFEAVTFTFEVKAPIFVLRQWQRHRTWSFNEVSGRYREMKEDFYIPEIRNIGIQSKNNKQCRDMFIYNPEGERIRELIRVNSKETYHIYQSLLVAGTPRELARLVLPTNLYTRMYATVNLHNLARFLHLRDHPHAQYEIAQYAKAIKTLITPIVPLAMDALFPIG